MTTERRLIQASCLRVMSTFLVSTFQACLRLFKFSPENLVAPAKAVKIAPGNFYRDGSVSFVISNVCERSCFLRILTPVCTGVTVYIFIMFRCEMASGISFLRLQPAWMLDESFQGWTCSVLKKLITDTNLVIALLKSLAESAAQISVSRKSFSFNSRTSMLVSLRLSVLMIL